MKKLFWFMLTLILYGVSIRGLLASMIDIDTNLIGLAIVTLMFPSKTEKDLKR